MFKISFNAVYPLGSSPDGRCTGKRMGIVMFLIGVILISILTGCQILSRNFSLILHLCFLGAFVCLIIPWLEIGWFNFQAWRTRPKEMTAENVYKATIWIGRYYKTSWSLNGVRRQKLRFVLFVFGFFTMSILTLYINL